MAEYIDIDQRAMTINGERVAPAKMQATCAALRSEPSRYHCLLRNDYQGKYRYADFGDESAEAE